MNVKKLEKKAAVMECAIRDLLPMARRWAHQRQTFSPSIVNEHIDQLEAVGVEITLDRVLDNGLNKYATDPGFGRWCPVSEKFLEKEGG